MAFGLSLGTYGCGLHSFGMSEKKINMLDFEKHNIHRDAKMDKIVV